MTVVNELDQTQPRNQEISRWRWLLFFPLAGQLAGSGLYLYRFLVSSEWVYLAVSAAYSLAIILWLLGSALYRKDRLRSGMGLLIASIYLSGVAVAWIHPDGLLLSLLTGILLLLLVYIVLNPPQGWTALIVAGLYILSCWLVNRYSPGAEISLQSLPFLRNFHVLLLALYAVVLSLGLLNRLRTTSLRYRLLTSYILLAIIPITLLGIAAIYLIRQTSSTYAREELSTGVTGKASQIQNWFQELSTSLQHEITRGSETGSLLGVLENLSGTPEFDTAYRLQRQHLLNTINLDRQFQELYILDSRGMVILSTQPANEGALYFNQDIFRTGLNRTYLNVERTGVAANPFEVVVAAPIQGSNGRSVGVIAGKTNAENIRRLIESGLVKATDETYLIGDDQVLLTPLRAAQALTLGTVVQNEGISSALASRTAGTAIYNNVSGEPVVAAYRWIPVLNAILLSERNLDAVYLASNQFALLNVVLMLITLALTVAAGIIITNSITRPITELDATARRIAGGATHLRASVQGSDEISHLADSFNQMTARMEMLIEGLEQRVDERTLEAQRRSTQLAAAAELGSSIATIHQLDSLLNQVTSLITDKFGYYHCGIFFVDERAEYAVLQAANSEGGKRMLARGHKLGVGQTGIVGYVTAHGQARIALDVGFDAVYFDNPDLPETRSEIALPLIARGELLGALDVQSTEPAAFSEEDVEVLQLLADLIAVAIQNAQMMTRTQQALEAAQAAYGQFIQQAWAEKIRGKPEINFLSAAHFNGPTDEQWHPQSLAAYQTGQTVRGNGTAHRLAIPIKVRNTTIGVIDTFKPLESGDWTDEEIAMLENIISQLGIALESARLYEDTQLQAETERLLAQISSRMRATLDIDYVLQTAAQDLLRTFNLAEVEIRLEPEQSGRD